MKFLDIRNFWKAPKDLQTMLIESGVLPVTIVAIKTWDAIHAVNVDGSRKYRYIVEEGSSRSSKTYSLIDCYDNYARSYKNKRLTVWRDTRTDCVKTVLNDTLKHLKQTNRFKIDQTFHETKSIFTYSNQSTFEIHGADDDETVHGLTQSVAWINEPYKIQKSVFDQIDQRTSDFIVIDWNPKKAHWIDDLKKDPRCIVIKSTFKDNPLCPIESKLKILSYQPVSMCSAVLDKILTENEARIYELSLNKKMLTTEQIEELSRCRENESKSSASEFQWSVYGLGEKAEKPNRIFNWQPISYNEYLQLDVKRYYATDWGKSDAWGILEAKYYDGTLYLHELNYASENKIREKLTATERELINANDEGIVTWMFTKLGIDKNAVIVCDNNRLLKIAALRRGGWVYARPATKGPGSINDGIDLLHNIQVCYTSCSENLEYEQENYSYIVDRYGVVTDEPEDTNNHLAGDPTRYIAQYLQSIEVIKRV